MCIIRKAHGVINTKPATPTVESGKKKIIK